MGLFERFLSVWVGLGMLAGVGLGLVMPGAFQAIAALEVAHVNLVVAVFIWVMIYPMMIQIDWSAVKDVGRRPGGLVLTLVVNWLIKPFTMALLGVLFFEHVFAPWVDPQSAREYIAGMILLGVAPCTAMVFVWSQLVKGDANYTLVQVSVNDLIMVVAFAPIAAFLLGVTHIVVPWETLVLSTVLYVVLPLLAGMATRHVLATRSPRAVGDFVARLKPWSVLGLIATVVLLFGFQASTIVGKPLVIAMIAVPLVLQSYGIFAIGWAGARAVEAAARHRRPGLPDRHLQLLRAGGGGGDLAVRAELGCGAGHGGGRAGRGAGDAVAVLAGQPQRGGAGVGTGLTGG